MSEVCRILIDEEELKIELKWPGKASAINCGSVVILPPTLPWVMY
jgi:hypothetical protein